MTKPIDVPDTPAPVVELCWLRDRSGIVGSAGMGEHCILQKGHAMPHSWACRRIKEAAEHVLDVLNDHEPPDTLNAAMEELTEALKLGESEA